MADKFHSIHIIQASLQAFDVPMNEIREFLDAFEKLAASPEDFANWNKELDSKGMAVLTLLFPMRLSRRPTPEPQLAQRGA
jgi:hypothetical protein